MNRIEDLINWLRAQLDQDERQAADASPGPWSFERGRWQAADDSPVLDSQGDYLCCSPDDGVRGGHKDADAEYIAAWHPVRVLAEIKAKRAIIAGYEASYRQSDDYPGWEGAIWCIAQPYAGRPGWQPGWAV